MAFNLNGFQTFNQSVLDSQGRVVEHLGDVLKRPTSVSR